MGLGLTCVVRILVTHSEGRTLILNAGFFTYLYFYGFYSSWGDVEEKFAKFFADKFDEDWNLTQQLFILQKSHFFIIVVAQILAYYAHVYKQATWLFVDETAPHAVKKDDKSETTADQAIEQKTSAPEVKGGKGKKPKSKKK